MREIDAYTRGLVAGLAEMSSDCCVNGPSRLTAFCYGLDTFKAELSLEIGPDAQLFEQPSDEIVLMEIFSEVFGEDYDSLRAASKLLSRLRAEFGQDIKVLSPVEPRLFCEAYSGYSGGNGPFYIVESVFAIVFEEAAVLFVFGNDE